MKTLIIDGPHKGAWAAPGADPLTTILWDPAQTANGLTRGAWVEYYLFAFCIYRDGGEPGEVDKRYFWVPAEGPEPTAVEAMDLVLALLGP